jgi:hypothetical protein
MSISAAMIWNKCSDGILLKVTHNSDNHIFCLYVRQDTDEYLHMARHLILS